MIWGRQRRIWARAFQIKRAAWGLAVCHSSFMYALLRRACARGITYDQMDDAKLLARFIYDRHQCQLPWSRK